NIGILSNFDIPVSAENEEASVAPGSQAVWREPIQAHVAQAAIASKYHVAEVLETRILRVADICHLRFHHLGLLGTRVIKELVCLVRADVAQDAAVLIRIVEPGRSGRSASGVA